MRILIGYDGSRSADAALDDLGRAGLPREVEALVVSVGELIPPPSSLGDEADEPPQTSRRLSLILAQVEARAAEKLQEVKEFAAKAADRVQSSFPDWKVQSEGLPGGPSTELVHKADEWKADLVIVGSHGHSTLGRFVAGSVSTKLVTDSHHSVRVARGTDKESAGLPPKIMIGVDASPEAEHAVRAVGMRVWPQGTQVRIVAVDDGTSPARISHILPTAAAMIRSSNEKAAEEARMMVDWAENELRAIGLRVSVAVEKGDPQRVLIEEALKWDADSIFVGGRKFGGAMERIRLGSVSTAVVTNAHCSVEVVRSQTS
jgi:nucleotide-binding universal stress UspA family protein